jgi:hypothetical protein
MRYSKSPDQSITAGQHLDLARVFRFDEVCKQRICLLQPSGGVNHKTPKEKSMSDILTVGKKLVELCREGKNMEVLDTLYSKDIVSVEAIGGPEMPARMEGIDAIKGKATWWEQNHEVHKAEVEGPYPHGDRFIVHFKYDVTAKSGPFAGKRMLLD